MAFYIFRRILWMVPTMIGITLLLFVVMRLAPGDPSTILAGSQALSGEGGTGMTKGGNVNSAIAKFREKNRLDDPIYVQYFHWMKSLMTLDFGNEFFRPNVSVRSEVWRRMQVTVPLALASAFLSYLIALPLGIMSAAMQGSRPDKISSVAVFLLYSMPQFWAGLLLIMLFGANWLGWLPVLGLHDKEAASWIKFTADTPLMAQLAGWTKYTIDALWHSILPIVCLTYGSLAFLSRQMRVGMLEVIRQDYIRTARAKGLSERTVIFKHALRNSLMPVVTLFASILPYMIGGALIVETIFTVQGLGLYAFQGLLTRDYNVVMATTTMTAFMTLVGFLMSDIAYAVVDPRVAYE